jgi:hypothetical protein
MTKDFPPAYHEGNNAYYQGKRYGDNPYLEDDINHFWWINGYFSEQENN